MKNTTHYNLKKPESADYYNVEDQNTNMDIIDEEISNKVDKIAGKGLSTEDYTTVEKNKLAQMYDWATGLFSLKGHHHDTVYEKTISKKSGFNLEKSDSVSSSSSSILATLSAVKTAYDKAVSAYNLASSKLGVTATATDSNKYKNREDIFHPDNYGKIVTISSSVILDGSHVNKVLRFVNSSDIIVTVPTNLSSNGKIAFVRAGSGKVTTTAGSGMTINSVESKRSIKDKFALNVLMFNALNSCDLFGSLE